jgi:type I restriction enzyme, S subunit
MSFVESNELWLGKVPSKWKRSRIRNVAQFSPGYSSTPPTNDEVCTVVPMELLSADGKVDLSSQLTFEDIQAGLNLLEQGDVLFAKITPCMENGKGAFVQHLPTRYAFGSTEFHVLRPGCTVHPKFLYYYTFNPVYRAYAAENMSGAAGQKRVSTRFLKDTRLFLPSLPEQQRIAAYLDASCAAIDAAVAAKRRQLETLDELCSSIINQAVTCGCEDHVSVSSTGIDWFPEIPSKWRVVRFKSLFRLIYRYPTYFSIEYVPEGIPEVRGEALTVDGFIETLSDERYISQETSAQFPKTQLEIGDIVMSVRGTMGKIGLVNDKYVGANITANLLRLSPCKYLVGGEFLRWLMRARYFNEALNSSAPQTTIKTITMPQLAKLRVALPPKPEQHKICKFLELKIADVKNIAIGIESQIATLSAYRKSLIHECVTGQRRITEADIRKAQNTGD